MQPIWCNVATLAVALIFYLWRTHYRLQLRRARTLRERVTYLLWVAAGQTDARPSHPILRPVTR
jgi:hypothetical protein